MTPEQYEFQRDAHIRARVKKIYNKQRRDFETDDDYDAYLEEIEDKIQALLDNRNADQVEKEIRIYER